MIILMIQDTGLAIVRIYKEWIYLILCTAFTTFGWVYIPFKLALIS